MTARTLPELAATLARPADPTAPGVTDGELLRRFADARDEAAFELLVWRHGDMVLGTCRRVLGRSVDADDAFQAAFLALARKAGSVRHGESLPGWLHRVALRAALRLRAGRRALLPLPEVAAPAEPLPDDTAAILDEEISRLPDKLRVAFVLCALEGRSDTEAAKVLGCPKGTVLSRLSRARERLRARLTRRGLAGATTGVLGGAPAALSAARVAATARAGVSFAAGRVEGAASAKTAALAHGVLRAMASDGRGPGTAVLTVAGLVAVAVGATLATSEPVRDAPLAPSTPTFVAAPVPKIAPAPQPYFKLAVRDQGVARVRDVQFSPNDKWLVTAGHQMIDDQPISAVAVWDAATGEHVRTFSKPDEIGLAQAFSRDSKLFATANGPDHTVTLWDTETWKQRASLPHEFATNVSFSPSGKLLVSQSASFTRKLSSEVRVWHTDSGKAAFDVSRKENETLYPPAISPDEKTLAVGNSHGVVKLIETKTGRVRFEIKTPEVERAEVAFSPRGDRLLTWSHNEGEVKIPVRVWDAATGKEELKLKHDDSLWYVTFSPDGKRIATVRGSGHVKDSTVWLWDAATGKQTASFRLSTEHPTEAHSVCFSPDGTLMAVCGSVPIEKNRKLISDPFCVVYSVPDGNERRRLPGVWNFTFNHNGTTAALVTGPTALGRQLQETEPDEVIVRGVRDLLGLR